MDRATKLFLLLTCPLLACSDDLPTPADGSTSGEDGTTTTPVTVTVSPTMTDSDTGSGTTDSGVDSTGTTTDDMGTSSSSEGGATESSSDGGSSSSSSGGMSSSSSDGGMSSSSDGGSSSSSGGPSCGDGVIDMGEDCDGMALGGETCVSQGFVGGMLACDPVSCTFDTSGCTSCGNGVIDMGEDCDGMDLGGAGCVDMGMGFTGGALSCDGACGFDTASCTSVPWPVAGEVVITEIMQNPSTLGDSDGEFFELYNPTMANYQLGNCFVEGSTDVGFPVDVDLEIGPLSYRTFAITGMVGPGFVPDYQWPSMDFSLNNSSDTVRLVCDGVVVDEVSYDNGATFPDPNGASMNLDPTMIDAMANDLGANWCEATSSYNGDLGTPGADNTPCVAPPMYSIDFCRLQFPEIIDEVEGTMVDVFGRVYIAGLTDISGVNDLAPEVIGYVGYGPDGTDPSIDPGWTWTAGTDNAGYGPASPGYEVNNDEYQAVLTVPSPPGAYDFAFRFTGDGGSTFTYCDGQPAGNSDGYQPANAGQMTSQAGMAPGGLYFSEYAEGSSNNKALEVYNSDGVDADLTSCVINFYANGAMAPTSVINLAGTLAADDVLVVCDDNIDPAIFDPMNCDVLSAVTFYNGDDAVELACSGMTLDVIGQIGNDPGTEWIAGGVGTQNETIRRSCTVTTGDSNGADPFDPSLEWATFAQDDFSDFGQYICP
ncbi:MAG: lamin tail domain-containing protein [Myxococcales bacterium]|nr:lamin tail domain-containing protein [Myxococcales bacterium]